MYTALSLAQRLVDWLNGDAYAPGHPITDESDRTDLQLGTLLDTVAALDETDAGHGSDLIGVYDEHAVFTGTTLTDVLYELYQAATSAGSDSFTDTGNFYATDTVGAAFVALGTALGGTNSTTRNYTGGTGTRLIDNDSFFTALDKLDQGFVNLASVANAKGAALVGINDAGNYITGATVEAALQEFGAERVGRCDQSSPGNGGAIPTGAGSGVVKVTSAGAETRTLANPQFIGQTLTIYFQTDGGDVVIAAASPINQAGNQHITLNDAGDSITLRGIHNGAGFVWRVVENDGCTLAA